MTEDRLPADGPPYGGALPPADGLAPDGAPPPPPAWTPPPLAPTPSPPLRHASSPAFVPPGTPTAPVAPAPPWNAASIPATDLPGYSDQPMFMTTEPAAPAPWIPSSQLPPGPPIAVGGALPPGGFPPGAMVRGSVGPDGTLPLYPALQIPPSRRRSPARLAALAVAVIALVAGTSFAAYALTRPDGADSPDGAVRQMFSAIDHEDALGVIESLPPSERKALHDPLVESTQQLQRLGILKSFSLSNVPGADLKVTGLTTETTKLGDGVVLVNVTGGTISGTSIPAEVPLGDNLRKAIEDNGGSVDLQADSFSEDLADADLHLVAIEEGGGWHVSLTYSIAESIRGSVDDDNGHSPPVPDFGNGPAPVGADSPEGAVRGLVDAAVGYDAEKAITLTDPEEMRALYDYAPLFLPGLARSAAEARADGNVAVKVDRLGTSVEGDGPVRRVRITGLDVTLGDDTDNVHVVFDGTCYDATSTYTESFGFGSYDPATGEWSDPTSSGDPQVDHEHVCAGDPASSSDSGSGGMSMFGTLGMFGSASSEPFAVTVTQVDGRWYVSPVRTILDSVVESLEALQSEDVQKLGDQFGSFDSSGGSLSVGSAVPDDPRSIDPGINPSGPSTSTTDLSGSSDTADLFFGLTPATVLRVEVACAAELDAYSAAFSQDDPVVYFQSVRHAFGCAAGVVPGYTACLPLIDQVVVLARTEPDNMDAALDEMWVCTDNVTG